MNLDPLMMLIGKLPGTNVERNRDLVRLRGAIVDFAHAGRRLKAAGKAGAQDERTARIRQAAADLLAPTEKLNSALRRSLSSLKLRYAVVWGHWKFPDDEDFEDEDLDAEHFEEEAQPPDEELSSEEDSDILDGPDEDHPALFALEMTKKHIETLQESSGKIFEGTSDDGRVTARANFNLEIEDIAFDPSLLQDASYLASLMEAVNASIAPVVQTKDAWSSTFRSLGELDEPEPEPEPEPVDDDSDEIVGLLEGLESLEFLDDQLRRLAEDEIEEEDFSETILEVEEASQVLRRCRPALKRYRDLLEEKMALPEITDRDLEEVSAIQTLFYEEHLDDVSELAEFHGAFVAQEVIEMVSSDLRRKSEMQDARRAWKNMAAQVERQVAQVADLTFDGHSEDGSILARANGEVRLIELELPQTMRSEGSAFSASLIEAVNAAIKAAFHRRVGAMMIMPGF